MRKKIIIVLTSLGVLGGGYFLGDAILSGPPAQTFDYPLLQWNRPRNNFEWAEDVKRENFDIKSTEVLETMITTHQAKLEREEQAYVKYRDCPDCIRFEFREMLSQTMTGQELELEIEKQTQEAINGRALSIEKLKQSIERMQKEVQLRGNGFISLEGGGGQIIRQIHD